MGKRMVDKLVADKHEIVVWNRSSGPLEELLEQYENLEPQSGVYGKLSVAASVPDLVDRLRKPRVIWSMLPSGEVTKAILNRLSDLVDPGDIIIDGANSNYKDTEKRYEEFKERKIKFLGVGVSGGIISATRGYPLMAGGNKSAYEYIKPILKSLAKPYGGFEYFGEGGAGHFVKMIHNGIEYGIMQSLSEGFAVLQKAPYKFDLLKIANLYQKGTLVSGFMLDRAIEILEKNPDLGDVRGIIEESGEAGWTVEQAEEEEVDVASIKYALNYRRRSQTDRNIQKSYTAKLIASLRNAFGGHEVKKK